MLNWLQRPIKVIILGAREIAEGRGNSYFDRVSWLKRKIRENVCVAKYKKTNAWSDL